VKNTVLWNVTPFSLLKVNQGIKKTSAFTFYLLYEGVDSSVMW